MRKTLLLLHDSHERRALVLGRPSEVAFRSCGSVALLRTRLNPNVEAVVCEPGLGLIEEPHVLEMIDTYGIKLIMRCYLTHATAIELAALSQMLSNFRVSLRMPAANVDATRDLITVMDEPDGGPVGLLTKRIANSVVSIQGAGLRLVVAALVLGRDRTSVQTYAVTCGLAARSLQAGLQHVGLPSPHRLLAWGQACWMAWRMERYGWNSKQAAAAGGFSSSSRMAAALTAVTGKSPGALARCDSALLLTRFFEEEASLQHADR
jgi:hypothetical protein